jgi:hypothetical protein
MRRRYECHYLAYFQILEDCFLALKTHFMWVDDTFFSLISQRSYTTFYDSARIVTVQPAAPPHSLVGL